ncbi:protease inhibitor I42 family protein [Fusibacter sp. JL216-2]|uniref:protease inhibitor I42 family protein n=1 Tax=Fusibacter sp. JL216-2 TaxID=3071453 RepID=UPI003D34F21D
MNRQVRARLGAILVGLMSLSSIGSFADTQVTPVLISAPITEVDEDVNVVAVPVLYEDASVPFTVNIVKDAFTIILDSNPSTGYSWDFEVRDEKQVDFLSQDLIMPADAMPGTGGKATFTFKALEEGVSTIQFKYGQSWDESTAKTLDIMVYKNGDKLFVEEDKIVTIADGKLNENNDKDQIMDGKIEIDEENRVVLYNEEQVGDFGIEMYGDITMVPLSSTLTALGYEVTWNSETRSVDIQKGAQWTSIKIGENAYFKNRMAPQPLSAEPIIIDGYTYVPAEFLVEILGIGVQVESGSLILTDHEAVIHSGYVTDISYDETGTKTITIADEKGSTDYMNMTVIHTSQAYTYYNTDVEVGAYIHVASPQFMTMSLPAQTSGYIVY